MSQVNHLPTIETKPEEAENEVLEDADAKVDGEATVQSMDEPSYTPNEERKGTSKYMSY